MLAQNWRTINPAAGVIVGALWLVAAGGLGAGCGWLAGRGFPLLRVPPGDAAAFFSAFVVGHLFAPPLVGPAAGIVLLAGRSLRRRLLPRRPRLDAAFPAALVAAVGAVLLPSSPALPPPPPDEAALEAGSPLPGSVPVTISVHGDAPFPSIAAVHVPLRELAAEEIGARAALWSGRAPARTRAGRHVPRRVAGGGLSCFPDRPIVGVLAALFPRADASDPAFRTVGTLPEIVAAAGIPVLRGPPSPSDPPLFLRIVEDSAPPSVEVARSYRAAGTWIDVTLAPSPHGEIALAGEGVAMARSGTPATLMDVTPTALHLLGLAVPRDTDGRVLIELLDTAGPGGRAPRYRSLGRLD